MLDDNCAKRSRDFNQFERRHALFEHRVDGWSAWRVVRNPLRRAFVSLPVHGPQLSGFGRAVEVIGATASLLSYVMLKRQPKDVLVKTCRSALRAKEGQKFRDVYFDGLLDSGYSYAKIEEVNAPGFEQQAKAAWKPSQLNSIFFTAWGRVLARLRPIKDEGFCNLVSQLLHEELDYQVQPEWIRTRLSTVYWQRRLYGLVLGRIKPQTVLLSDTGEYALIGACKDRRVRVIEYQHGVFDAFHPDAIPDSIPGTDAELLLPDVLACRGPIWRDALKGTRQHAISQPVGNEIIDRARLKLLVREPKFLRLVVTSQGLDSARLANWLDAMISLAPADMAWELSIKLHPIYDEMTDDFSVLAGDPRVTVLKGTQEPSVFDLLVSADLHISIASACHFDACALGVPSLIVPLAGYEVVSAYANGASLRLASSPGDVWSLLRERRGVNDMTYFSTPGFVTNMQVLIGGQESQSMATQGRQDGRVSDTGQTNGL